MVQVEEKSLRRPKKVPPVRVKLVRALVGLVLAIVCHNVLASQGNDSSGSSQAESIWRFAHLAQRQVEMDYVQRLKNELAKRPNDIGLETELGRAYFWMSIDRDVPALFESEKLFSSVLAADPNNATALAYHGDLLGLEISYRLVPESSFPAVGMRSTDELDRAIAIDPDSIETRSLRANADLYTPSSVGRDNLGLEDFGYIISRLERSPEKQEDLAAAYVGLGDMYSKMERRDAAQAAWRRVIQLAPGSNFAAVAASRMGLAAATNNDAGPGDARQLAAFFGFLIGLAIFGILAVRLIGELRQTRRDRSNIAASLVLSLLTFLWSAANLVAITLAALKTSIPGALTQLAAKNHGDPYLVISLSPIPLGLFLAYSFHKGTFMDTLLKKGAALLILLVLAVVNAEIWGTLVTLSSLEVLNLTLRPAIFTGLWLSLFALYLPLRGRVYWLVDRYLLKRRDYSQLIRSMDTRGREVTDEETLKGVISDVFKEAFTADYVRMVSAEDELALKITGEMKPHGGDILLQREVASDDLYLAMRKQHIELALAVRSPGGLIGIFLFGPRAYGQGYLSEELKVLRTVATHVVPVIENCRLQEVRRRHAVAEQELRKLATQAELKALRAQIDPHFFFNALNSVAALIGDEPEAAERLVEDISELFRYAFRPNRDFISLGEELELVATYLKVEHARLGGKLSFEQHVQPSALPVKVPALSIQPLIENAVKHGISKSNSPGLITLSGRIEGGTLEITVSDNGIGIAPADFENIFSDGVGLTNVNSRLVALYGEESRLKVDSGQAQGTTVRFAVPVAPVLAEVSVVQRQL